MRKEAPERELLAFERPLNEAARIYAKRFAWFGLVVLANLLLLFCSLIVQRLLNTVGVTLTITLGVLLAVSAMALYSLYRTHSSRVERRRAGGPAIHGNTGGVNISGGQIHARDIVGGNQYVYEAPTPVVPALHQLPPPPGDFTGRAEELSELKQAVEKGGVTISGLGGVGKTALALKLAAQLTPRYPDAQFYL